MGGGLMQLVAYGAQDIYLTGNPQITFFKVVYRRHTNFSMETIEQTINGTAIANGGGTGNVTISRNGDLVHRIYVTSSTPGISNGGELVSEVELEIGGQRIDRHYKEWTDTWNELSTPESKSVGLKSMQGCIGNSGTTGVGMVQVPLNFWFCRNPGLALPLIALQYHEVKLKFIWGTDALTGIANATCKVMCDYIYLDTDERRRFAQVSHEYLIEQVQKQSASDSKSQKLNFNHPVKEIIWTSSPINTYTDAKLVLNGHDRFSAQEEEYFQIRQPYDYHTAVPEQNLPFISNVNFNSVFTTFGNANYFPQSTGDACGTAGEIRYQNGAATTLVINCTAETTVVVGDVFALHIVRQFATGDYVATGSQAAVGNTYYFVATAAVTCAANTAANIIIDAPPRSLSTDGVVSTLTDMFDSATGQSLASIAVSLSKVTSQSRTSKMTKKINVYSFGLKPEEHQPSGTCNFSRIDNAKLETSANLTASDNIYAVNYNVLRIMSGMGGLAYSN